MRADSVGICDYRLNVYPLTLPTLRERRDDIPLLAKHLVDRLSRTLRKPIDTIPPHVMRALESYDWPGNVRELENILQRGIIGSSDGVLALNDVWLASDREDQPSADLQTLADIERAHIIRILWTTSWRIEGGVGAARVLGVNPSTLRSRMRKLGIKRPH